ncbi:MAG: protein-glutamate O-methyltransferase CheR [Moraxellaceae bacterium]|nr:protein-glutamate O-methyltransferase CheR [Moraxellaceae bacterium]
MSAHESGLLSDDDIQTVLTCIRRRAGLVFEPEKRYLVESRLQKLAQSEGKSLAQLVQALDAGDERIALAVTEAMTIQETYFFRDPWLFDSLRTEVIPALLQRRASERSLHLWCAACATGQEVWSLVLLLESIPELAGWDVQILASDFSPQALARAQAGRYSHMEVNRGLPARELAVHFRRHGLEWEIDPALRRRVTFRQINLVEPWPDMPRFDIVLLRNVLIYFDEPTKREVLLRVSNVMQADGFLFMGGAESPVGVVDRFLPGVSNRACYHFLQRNS